MLKAQPSLPRTRARGMTLIELMIGIALVSILLMMGMPSLSVWMQNSRIRAAAETLQNSVQHARAEAVRRNQVVRIQLVDTLDNACNLSSTGMNWATNVGSGTTPASGCGEAISDTGDFRLVQKGPLSTAANVRVTASQTVYAFNGMGQQAATTNPTTTPPSGLSVALTSTQGSCVKDGGEIRCLNITVSPAGQVRMCDPSVSTTGDAVKC